MTARRPSRSWPQEPDATSEMLAHPMRFRIVMALEAEPRLSAREVADRIGESPRSVRYQLRLLRDAGLVEVSGQGERRGAIEHRFTALGSLFGDDAESESRPAPLRSWIALEILRLTAADIAAAARQGTFGIRHGHVQARTPGVVDGFGWEELAKIHRGYFLRAGQVIEDAREKITLHPQRAIPVSVSLVLFEDPEWPSPPTTRRPGSEPALVGAFAQTTRDPALFRLGLLIDESPGMTVRQMADRIDEPPRRVRYLLDRLRDVGLVEVSGRRAHRGAVEHHYSTAGALMFSDKDLDSVDGALRAHMASEILRRTAADVEAATAAGTFAIRPGTVHVRRVGEVDERGWRTLADLSLGLFEETGRVMDESRIRVGLGEEVGTSITSAIFLVDRPAEQPAAPAGRPSPHLR